MEKKTMMDFPMNSMFEESYRINTVPYVSSQGSLISENNFTLVPSLIAKSLSLIFSIKCKNLMDSDLVHFFEDMTILKTPSEIKPPLKNLKCILLHHYNPPRVSQSVRSGTGKFF